MRLRILLPIALVIGLLAGMAAPAVLSGRAAPLVQSALPTDNASVVISEFRTRGPAGTQTGSNDSNSEFIEIFNRTGFTINIGGWYIEAANESGGKTIRKNQEFTPLPANTLLQPGQHYLIANDNAPDSIWNQSDATYGGDISDAGGIALFNASNQKVDAAGMSTTAIDFWEGNTLAPMTGNADQSYLRAANGCTDSGDNASDFALGASDAQDSTVVTTCAFLTTTTTTITSVSSASSDVNVPYTVNFSVSPNAASGTVSVDDGTESCTGSLSGGTGSCNLTSRTAGNKVLTAHYSGDFNYLQSTSSGVPHIVTQPVLTQSAPVLSVVINEVGWAGTAAFATDEWIELYNPGPASINLTGWSLKTDDGNVNITWSSSSNIANDPNNLVIAGGAYYLIERDDNNTVFDVAADKLFTSEVTDSLDDDGARLILTDPGGRRIDTANIDGGAWPAGSRVNFRSMERYRSNDADFPSNWVTNTGVKRNGLDSGVPSGCTTNCNTAHRPINGTPKQRNWAATVTLTPTPKPPTKVPTRTKPPQPRPVLNEFLARAGFDWNQDGKVDVFDEFIEVANIGPVDWNTAGWRLDTGPDSDPYVLPSMAIKPGGRAVFYGAQTGLHLTDGGATVRLLSSSGVVYDARTYTVVKTPDKSTCRIRDLSGDWYNDCFPTPNFPNSREGQVPSLPPGTGLETPLCRLADTLPAEFIQAECSAYGDGMWNSRYWDLAAQQGEFLVPQNGSKWDIFIE